MIIETELFNKIKELTLMDYEVYKTKNEGKVLITNETILAMYEDLICEIESQKEKYEDLMQTLENNYEYKPQPDPDVER